MNSSHFNSDQMISILRRLPVTPFEVYHYFSFFENPTYNEAINFLVVQREE
jgi:hypothetical protein